MIEIICDKCKTKNDKEYIRTCTLTINRTDPTVKGNGGYIAAYTSGCAYPGPEFYFSVDLCQNCYTKWKDNIDKEVQL